MDNFKEPSFYLPHRPPMMFIEKVLSITDDNVVTSTNTCLEGPLACMFNENQELPSTVLLEIMAQTIGVWAGWLRQQTNSEAAEVGLLLSVRGMKFSTSSLSKNVQLQTEMHKLIQDGNLATFEGAVSFNGKVLASGKLTVYQPKKSEFAQLFA